MWVSSIWIVEHSSDKVGGESMNVLNNCNTIESKVVMPPVSVQSKLKHSFMHSGWLPSNMTHRGKQQKAEGSRQICLFLSETAGCDSTAAQGEHPMRHLLILSLRQGETP